MQISASLFLVQLNLSIVENLPRLKRHHFKIAGITRINGSNHIIAPAEVNQMADSEQFSRMLAQQLSMTRATWNELIKRGVSASTELQLDFACDSLSYTAAVQLRDFLRNRTDYDVRVAAYEDRWRVTGTTRPTFVSLMMLEQWVEWMVTAAQECDGEFDGWGTETP